MAPTVISNSVTNANIDRSKKKKKKKSLARDHHQQQQQQQNQSQNQIRWKSETQQRIYSSRLIQALSQVKLSSGGASPSAPRGGKAVREAADTALAVAAKGRSRWSRAILTNRLKLKFRKQHKRQRVTSAAAASSAVVTGSSRSKKPRVSVLRLKGRSLPAVQRKVRVLGRLVPGCRKQPLPVILEETIDYIPALEMQIRAMSAVFQLFSASTSAAASTSSAPPS